MNQFLYIILKVLCKATNTNPTKNRQSGRQQLLEKGKKKTGSDNRLQNRPAVCMGFDRTLTLMTMKNVTSD